MLFCPMSSDNYRRGKGFNKMCLNSCYVTDYWAESLSWYSLDRAKHIWTPWSYHNRFMTWDSSNVRSPSMEAPTIVKNFRADSWQEGSLKSIFSWLMALIIAIRLWIVFECTTGLYWRHSSLVYPDSWIILFNQMISMFLIQKLN